MPTFDNLLCEKKLSIPSDIKEIPNLAKTNSIADFSIKNLISGFASSIPIW